MHTRGEPVVPSTRLTAGRRFLILHGLGNRRAPRHWQWWLADQLRSRGEQVLYPQFPTPDEPDLPIWLELLASEYGQLGGGERVVVCHSLGCAVWYEASRRGAIDPPADRLLFVAPPGPVVLARPVTHAFVASLWESDVLARSCKSQLRLVASDADPNCPEGPAAVVYGQPLGLDAETLPGAGHLTPSDGYGPWPDVLAWCLDGSTRFRGT